MVVNFHCCPLKIQQIRAKQTMSDCYMSKKSVGLYLEKFNNLGEVAYL